MTATVWTNQQVLNQMVSGAKWTGTTITYAFPSTTTGLSGSYQLAGFSPFTATQQAMAKDALGLWDDLIAPSLVQTTSTASNIEFGNSTGVSYAETYYPTGGTVWVNPNYSELASPVIGEYGFMTYIHELGHAFGLNHMGNYNGSGNWQPSSFQDSTVYSVMSYFGPDHFSGSGQVAWANWVGSDGVTYSPQTPMLNDIFAIQSIYGADLTTRTGDTVYGFHSTQGSVSGGIYDFTQNLHPIMCIYDAAGNDTLDVSGWSTSATIDLVPGTFSSCNGMTNNISISYTTIIENVVGGAGNDVLIGNAYNNTIDGGAGNDTITGGMGNDTIIGGAGTDTAVYTGNLSAYALAYDAATQTFTISGGSDGTDKVTGVEVFQFADGTITAAALQNLATGVGVLPPIAVSIAADVLSQNEGNSGVTDFTFTVTLDSAATSAQTVHYTVAGNGANAANAADFSGLLAGNVAFAIGEITKTIHVSVVGDKVFEQDETFGVTLSSPTSGLTLGTATATSTILNDDNPPTLNGNNLANILNGTVWNDTINGYGGNDTINGLAGNDIINGGGGNDIINGGLGNDIMTGGTGADTFRFTDLHFGNDKITDFVHGTDKLSFSADVASAFSDFTIAGNGTGTVTLWHGTDSIVFHNASNAHLTLSASDFIFV